MARVGQGEAFVVTGAADAARTARQFSQYISAPALTNIRVEADGVELYDLEPARVPDMLAQRPVMVIGKYRNATDDASIRLTGVGGQGAQLVGLSGWMRHNPPTAPCRSSGHASGSNACTPYLPTTRKYCASALSNSAYSTRC